MRYRITLEARDADGHSLAGPQRWGHEVELGDAFLLNTTREGAVRYTRDALRSRFEDLLTQAFMPEILPAGHDPRGDTPILERYQRDLMDQLQAQMRPGVEYGLPRVTVDRRPNGDATVRAAMTPLGVNPLYAGLAFDAAWIDEPRPTPGTHSLWAAEDPA